MVQICMYVRVNAWAYVCKREREKDRERERKRERERRCVYVCAHACLYTYVCFDIRMLEYIGFDICLLLTSIEFGVSTWLVRAFAVSWSLVLVKVSLKPLLTNGTLCAETFVHMHLVHTWVRVNTWICVRKRTCISMICSYVLFSVKKLLVSTMLLFKCKLKWGECLMWNTHCAFVQDQHQLRPRTRLFVYRFAQWHTPLSPKGPLHESRWRPET